MKKDRKLTYTLLFSALCTQIFAVKRSKNELSKKNAMSARIFIHKFPKMYDFLLNELKLVAKNIVSGAMCPEKSSLYLILILINIYIEWRFKWEKVQGKHLFFKLRKSCAKKPTHNQTYVPTHIFFWILGKYICERLYSVYEVELFRFLAKNLNKVARFFTK